VANSAATSSVTAGKIGDGGGSSGLLGAIPRARRMREAGRCWGLARRRSGLFREIVEAPQSFVANFWEHLRAFRIKKSCTCDGFLL
jgi:hypothetical protein